MEDHEREKREAATAGLQNAHSNVKKPPPKPKQDSPKKEPKAQCDICKQTFQRMFNLKTHINRVSLPHFQVIFILFSVTRPIMDLEVSSNKY